MSRKADDHWLARPSTLRGLKLVFGLVLAASVAAQLVIPVKGYFGADGWFGFGAAFGFLSCLAMVLVAKGLGFVLQRDESYYREDGRDRKRREGGEGRESGGHGDA